MKKLNIALVWYWKQASSVMPNWRDGLRAALEIIEKDHSVSWFLDETIPVPEDNFDIILLWSDDSCPFIQELPKYKAKKGLCLTTNPHNPENLRAFDVVFCESVPVLREVRNFGINSVLAFGTDTDFFRPRAIKKDIEYFYPATFSPWKRQSEISYLGSRLLCVGTVQPDGQGEFKICVDAGVKTEIGYFPPEKILGYYQRARNVVIPAIHGSERTVLEAMSCNILPEVTNPMNVKTRSIVEEFKKSDYHTPRDFVVAKYNARKYAETMLKALI